MRKVLHAPHHWLHVALVAAAALLVFSEAHGQKQDAAATYEGRPAMAGAQAGQGAAAGLPQGGIGVQGTVSTSKARADMAEARSDVAAPKKDTSLAKEQRSAARKAKKAAKRLVDRKGIPPIESRTPADAMSRPQ